MYNYICTLVGGDDNNCTPQICVIEHLFDNRTALKAVAMEAHKILLGFVPEKVTRVPGTDVFVSYEGGEGAAYVTKDEAICDYGTCNQTGVAIVKLVLSKKLEPKVWSEQEG